MTDKYISFESVVDWTHLPISEELFRKKHQDPLIEFRKDVTALMKDVQSHLSFIDDISRRGVKSEEERVSNSKKVLDQTKLESERLRNEIIEISNQNDQLKDSFQGLNDRVKAFQAEASELTQLKKAFSAEVKDTYQAFILAKDCYKDRLKMYFTIEGSPDAEEVLVLLEFFTSKKRSNPDHLVTIARNKTDNRYRLIDMKPKLVIFPKLSKRLIETNDISGLLCCLRKCLMSSQRNI